MKRPLEGIRVALLATDGFEQDEIKAPRRALTAAGADVRVISLQPGPIRGTKQFLDLGRKARVDETVADARPLDYGALFLAGGFDNPDLLRQSERALAFVRGMEELSRPIATVSHGARVLASAGLVNGRRLTSWPSIAADVASAGAQWSDAPFVRDGRLVSGRGPQDLDQFIPAMIDLFDREGIRATRVAERAEARPRRGREHDGAQLPLAAALGAPVLLGLGLKAVLGRRKRAAARRSTFIRSLLIGATAAGAVAAWRKSAGKRPSRRGSEMPYERWWYRHRHAGGGASRSGYASPSDVWPSPEYP